LRLDEVVVDLSRVLERFEDRSPGDLMEDHPFDRHLGLEDLHQVTADGLPFAIFISGEQ